VKEKIDQLEKGRKMVEENEKEKKCNFMKDWKEKVERKRKQEKVQRGWKDLLESVEKWEELQEGESAYENLEEEPDRDWTEEGFQEAGEVMENVLSEVMAFLELSGTVQDNNYNHLENYSNNIIIEPEPAKVFNHRETETVTETVPTVPIVNKRRLQSVTVPPDRSGELEELKTKIERIELEMQRLKKADNFDLKGKIRTVPPKNHHRLKMSTRRKNRHEESIEVSKI
jgi:hypothetical protein